MSDVIPGIKHLKTVLRGPPTTTVQYKTGDGTELTQCTKDLVFKCIFSLNIDDRKIEC